MAVTAMEVEDKSAMDIEDNVNGTMLAPNSSDYYYYYEYYYDADYYSIEARVQYLLVQPHIILALLFGCIGIVANVLSLLAVSKSSAPMRSHFRLIQNLAVSDVMICLSVVLHFVVHVVNPLYHLGQGPTDARLRSRCVYMAIKALNNIALSITLLNLMAMAIDHYIAVFRPLHYARLMSKERTIIMISVLWFIALLCGFSDFLSAFPKYAKSDGSLNYCEFLYKTTYTEEFLVFALAILCFGVMLALYVRIYIQVRRHQMRDALYHEVLPNKKALITTLFILGTFIFCWLPSFLFQIVLLIQTHVNLDWIIDHANDLTHVDKYLYDLLLLNTLFDPIIYAVRMREVRTGYRELFRCCRQKGLPRLHMSRENSFSLLGETPRPSLSLWNGRSRNGYRRDSKVSNGHLLNVPSQNAISETRTADATLMQPSSEGDTKV